MRRREFLGLAALPLAQAITRDLPADAPGFAVGTDGRRLSGVEITNDRDGAFSRSRIVNRTTSTVAIKEVVPLDVRVTPSPDAALYGEGFQMLSQTGGTVGAPVDFSQYTDAKHYRIREVDGARAFYGLVTLTPPGAETTVLAFTSCARFCGKFVLDKNGTVRAVIDTEGLALEPGESWQLEELLIRSGRDRSALLAQLGERLARNHPPLPRGRPPTGWCSWYCFGPSVTAQQVLDNLDVIAKSYPTLRYVQIDDGYQSAMGDWLTTGRAFGGNVRTVLDAIRTRGFDPTIWVAPFVAEEASNLFRQHRDWFITDAGGAPLRSDRVTFGGWRRGPWYALDGTHPDVQQHFERLFTTMREEWGCRYFKLDANFWGAMHGGRFQDPKATRIEAYRRGMQAIVRGAGDAFLLGCNHPIWPSLGLVHGSRSSNDIKRSWDRVMTTARQNLSRNWQNGRLWWNDPDAVVLAGALTDAECQFHATAIYATGGLVLSGDDLTAMPPARAAMLRKLLPPTGIAAEFADASLQVGIVTLPDARMICLFNWEDEQRTLTVPLTEEATVTDYWSGESLGRSRSLPIAMAPRSARLLKATS
jgi:alpha-galactosidase